MRTTLGRELIRQKLPEKFKSYADQVLDKKKLTELMTALAEADPDRYVDILQDLNNLGQTVVSLYGRNTALPFEDIKISKGVKSLNRQLHEVIDNVLNDDRLTSEQKEKKITDLCYKYTKKVEDAVFADNDRRRTAFASQINSGSRGNKTQLMQMQFGNMGMKDALNRDMPYMMIDPYAIGATPMGYWVSASSGRKGYYDVQAATGQSGYLGKRVTAATHDTIISEDDCGTTDTGIPFPANSPKNVGAVLLRPWHKYPAGTIVTDKMVGEADEDDEDMVLRSPITCKSKTGVCAKCSGLGENGKFPGIGEYVPMNAARTFVEVITQAGVGCLAPDTKVRMLNGKSKKIKDIKEGDQVLGVDWYGKVTAATVTRVYNHGPKPMCKYTFDGRRKLVCTEDHKVMVTEVELAVYRTDGVHLYSYQEKPIRDVSWHYGEVLVFRKCLDEPLQISCKYKFKEVGMVPAYDIEIDHPSHMFLLANGLVVSNSKHKGGVGGRKVEDPEGEDQPTGFRAVERLFTVPKNFQGGAVLSPVDGIVTNITPASQGGSYITVGSKTVYASPARTVKVKVGDKLFAGDVLTNGVPNPAEVVSYKGLGEGRKYFTNKLNKVLADQGWGTDRRNIEAFTRAFLNKVEITDPDGFGNYLPGDIVDYSGIASEWEPREGSVTTKADKAMNMYLEKPVLYYSVGTRITPEVANTLKKYKFDDVTVSDKEPPFSSKFMRPAEALQHSKYWLPRLAGERLRDSLFDAAQQGITDPYDSPSYVDKIVAQPFKP